MENKLSIFLSHSHKDIDIVRKIRDILELINCDPILFYLKCLDEDNDELESFIKREIESRNIFIYCKSKNSQNSRWVQKELEYIRSFDDRRLYTLDIEKSFEQNIVSMLNELAKMIKNNTVVLFFSESNRSIAEQIGKRLSENGFSLQFISSASIGYSDSIPSMKGLSSWEYTKIHDMYVEYFDDVIAPKYDNMSQTGIVMPLISNDMFDGEWSSYIVSKSINWFTSQRQYKIIDVILDQSVKGFEDNTHLFWDGTDNLLNKIVEKAVKLAKED